MCKDIMLGFEAIKHCRDDLLMISCLLRCFGKIIMADCSKAEIKICQLKGRIINAVADVMLVPNSFICSYKCFK